MQNRTVLRPNFVRVVNGETGESNPPSVGDYITVPKTDVYGTWKVSDILPSYTIVRLENLRDSMLARQRANRNKIHKVAAK